jgi:ubiquinone/menaquinone biosynthesis C-methylase UbiE
MDDERFIEVVCDDKRRKADYKDMVIAYYDRVTDGYRERWGDSFHLPVFSGSMTLSDAIANIERRIASEGGFDANARVLDVGCGVGGPTLLMATLTKARLIGVNLVPRQIEIARRRAIQHGLADQVRFEVGDGMDLAFEDGSFDGVTVFESGCHMPEKDRFYRECARVLKPGGRFLGIDWMTKEGISHLDTRRYIEPICRLHGIPNLISVDEFRSHLRSVGLIIETFEDLTPYTGLSRMPVTDVPDWTSVFSQDIPPVQALLSLGGLALAIAARAGAFVVCHWTSRRILDN